MRRTLPVLLAAIAGIIVLINTFLFSGPINALATSLIDWAVVIGAIALLLGVINIVQVHWARIRAAQTGRSYSVILLASMLATILIGLIAGTDGSGTVWIVNYIYRPLGASFFALVAFFVATAAYRGLRFTNPGMGLMLITTVLILIGLAPLEVIGLDNITIFRDVANWVLLYPSVALQRGIILSTALGAILVTLRVLLGMDRHYLE